MDLSTFLLAQQWLSKFSDSGVGDGGSGLDDGVGAGVGDVVGLHTQFSHKRIPDASKPRRCQVIFSGTCCFRSAERILYFGTTSQRPDATQTVRMPSVPCAALAYRCWRGCRTSRCGSAPLEARPSTSSTLGPISGDISNLASAARPLLPICTS